MKFPPLILAAFITTLIYPSAFSQLQTRRNGNLNDYLAVSLEQFTAIAARSMRQIRVAEAVFLDRLSSLYAEVGVDGNIADVNRTIQQWLNQFIARTWQGKCATGSEFRRFVDTLPRFGPDVVQIVGSEFERMDYIESGLMHRSDDTLRRIIDEFANEAQNLHVQSLQQPDSQVSYLQRLLSNLCDEVASRFDVEMESRQQSNKGVIRRGYTEMLARVQRLTAADEPESSCERPFDVL